jgi:hypothetical protein
MGDRLEKNDPNFCPKCLNGLRGLMARFLLHALSCPEKPLPNRRGTAG